MTPYYDDGTATIYHGDCREIDAWLSADVMVTDPPYGIGWTIPDGWTNSKGRGARRSAGKPTNIAHDDSTDARDDVLRLWGDRPALIFGSILKPNPPGTVHVLIYAKPGDAGMMASRAGRRKDVEAIYMTGRWPRGVGGKTSIIRTNGRVAGPTGIGLRAGHPHAKPLDVMHELIELMPGVIADPFMGSGSTLVAAKQAGRRAVGVEIEERYCEVAAKRLAQEVLSLWA